MRDTAEQAPAGAEAEAPPAPPPEHHNPAPAEDIERAPQPAAAPRHDGRHDEPDTERVASPLVLPGGPVAAIAMEAVAGAGAGLWLLGGWGAVAAAVAATGAVGAGAAGRRARNGSRSGSSWSGSRTRTRSWSSRTPGRPSTRAGGNAGRRAGRAGTPPSFGRGNTRKTNTGTGAGAGRGRAGSRTPRLGARTRSGGTGSFPRARRTAARFRSTAAPTARKVGRAAGRGADRAAGLASRGWAASRAAHGAVRHGGTARGAARAARAALRDGHRHPPGRGWWRRQAGAAAWTGAAFLWGLSYSGSRAVGRRVADRLGWGSGTTTGGAAATTEKGATTTSSSSARSGTGHRRGDGRRIGTNVQRPAARSGGGNSRGEQPMTTASFLDAAREFAEAIRRYEPPDEDGAMYDFYLHIGQFPDVLHEITSAMRTFEERCANEWPLHSSIAEFIGAVRDAQEGVARASEDIRPAIARHHHVEIESHESPQRNQHMWNVPRGGWR
ncbi:hypothetical protein [Actinomadura litoris]|uniref:hypothetical protein n=1 Tax=Actinomadura litoris TaxID=2678616 RepID=UPI001FA72151|nr:hypothetical protein [Actinomadura litoris]